MVRGSLSQEVTQINRDLRRRGRTATHGGQGRRAFQGMRSDWLEQRQGSRALTLARQQSGKGAGVGELKRVRKAGKSRFVVDHEWGVWLSSKFNRMPL